MQVSQKRIEANRRNAKKGGRKKGVLAPHTLAKQKAEALLVAALTEHLPDVVIALTEAAKGMWVEVRKDGETVRVYREVPQVNAIRELFDRVMGKAKQPIDIPDGDDVQMTISLTGRAKEMAKKYNNEEESR